MEIIDNTKFGENVVIQWYMKQNERKRPINKIRTVQGIKARRKKRNKIASTTNAEVFKSFNKKYHYLDTYFQDFLTEVVRMLYNSNLSSQQETNLMREALIRPIREGKLGHNRWSGKLKDMPKNVGVDSGQMIENILARVIYE